MLVPASDEGLPLRWRKKGHGGGFPPFSGFSLKKKKFNKNSKKGSLGPLLQAWGGRSPTGAGTSKLVMAIDPAMAKV